MTLRQLDDYKDKIKEGVQEVLSSQRWVDFLQFHSNFTKYSFTNSMLIYLQKPDATYVATFRKWKKMNRFVKKGSKAIHIRGPVFRKEEVEVNGRTEEVQRLVSFRDICVFDISQTDGQEIPEICNELRDTGNTDNIEYLYNLLKDDIIENPVIEGDTIGNSKGMFNRETTEITVKSDMSYTQKFKTLIHEYAHAILHSNEQEEFARDQKEVEAESVAYITAQYFGVDTSDYSFEYLASWNQEDIEKFELYWERIQRTSKDIIQSIEDKVESLVTA